MKQLRIPRPKYQSSSNTSNSHFKLPKPDYDDITKNCRQEQQGTKSMIDAEEEIRRALQEKL